MTTTSNDSGGYKVRRDVQPRVESTCLAEHELSNALVHQKDEIVKLINFGTPSSLRLARELFGFVKPLWVACDYGYKVNEIQQRFDIA